MLFSSLYVRHIIVTHWRRFRGVWSRTSQTWGWSNFSRYSSYIVSTILGVECTSNTSNNNSSIGLLEVWFYLLLVAYVQGRKDSWFIPTKLATNLSVSLTDSSSRKQVCFLWSHELPFSKYVYLFLFLSAVDFYLFFVVFVFVFVVAFDSYHHSCVFVISLSPYSWMEGNKQITLSMHIIRLSFWFVPKGNVICASILLLAWSL